jgi:hypothetical protein
MKFCTEVLHFNIISELRVSWKSMQWNQHFTLGSILYNGYRVFPGGKVRPGRDADPSPHSSAEVKNGVELYLYSP